jgi:hypothetical protein
LIALESPCGRALLREVGTGEQMVVLSDPDDLRALDHQIRLHRI